MGIVRVLTAIASALKGGVRLAGEITAATAEGVAELVASLFRRRAGTEETVEEPDAVGEAALQQIVDRERDRGRAERQRTFDKTTTPSPARILKMIAISKDERRAVDDALYDRVTGGWKLRHYASSLTADHWRSILHICDDALHRHLFIADVPGLPSFVRYDWCAGGKRARSAEEARRTAGWSAVQHYRDLLADALASGEEDVDQRMLWNLACQRAGG